jgi:hypothetical protein
MFAGLDLGVNSTVQGGRVVLHEDVMPCVVDVKFTWLLNLVVFRKRRYFALMLQCGKVFFKPLNRCLRNLFVLSSKKSRGVDDGFIRHQSGREGYFEGG